MADWTEFDAIVSDELMEQLENLDNGVEDRIEIPAGTYECVPEKIELTKSKNGNPMTVVWLRIVAGQYKKNMLFCNLVMKEKYGIHRAKEFMRKLEPSCAVKFESYTQWDILLKGIKEELAGKFSYLIKVEDSKPDKEGKVYKNYFVKDGPFEVPNDYVAPRFE